MDLSDNSGEDFDPGDNIFTDEEIMIQLGFSHYSKEASTMSRVRPRNTPVSASEKHTLFPGDTLITGKQQIAVDDSFGIDGDFPNDDEQSINIHPEEDSTSSKLQQNEFSILPFKQASITRVATSLTMLGDFDVLTDSIEVDVCNVVQEEVIIMQDEIPINSSTFQNNLTSTSAFSSANNQAGPSTKNTQLVAVHNIEPDNGLEDSDAVDEPDDDPDYIPNMDEENDGSDLEQQGARDLHEEQQNEEAVQPEDIDLEEGRKRRHKGQGEPTQWKSNKNKHLRMIGDDYLGCRRKKGENPVQDAPKEKRTLRKRCACKLTKVRKCSLVDEDERKKLHQTFWKTLNWDQRKVFVANCVTRVPIKRKVVEGESPRKGSMQYSLKVNGQHIPICKTMFLNTFSIGEWSALQWAKTSDSGMPSSQEFLNTDRRTSMPLQNHVAKEFLNTFLDSLPKLPSHYARKDSRKLYLEPNVVTWSQPFLLYKEQCVEQSKQSLSRHTFDKAINAKNIAIHTPKKDQCDICCSYKAGNEDESVWKEHIAKKTRARSAKENDKKDAGEGKCRVLTMDLQAVKVCPSLNASALYYKTKLVCHNFTVYDLLTHNVKCYWFTEVHADLVASTFTSCIIDYLNENCVGQNASVPIIIYSDGCTYQNRNAILSNALLSWSINTKIIVIQKFLERGHTQMECDSVHAHIETKLKGREIHLPSDYIKVTKEARKVPSPYGTKELNYDLFKDYSIKSLQRFDSIRPGRVTSDPTVTDIRVIKYQPDGTLEVKLDHEGDYMEFRHRMKDIEAGLPYPQMHHAPIKIPKRKWEHLQQLKKVINKDCHPFYDNLPHL